MRDKLRYDPRALKSLLGHRAERIVVAAAILKCASSLPIQHIAMLRCIAQLLVTSSNYYPHHLEQLLAWRLNPVFINKYV